MKTIHGFTLLPILCLLLLLSTSICMLSSSALSLFKNEQVLRKADILPLSSNQTDSLCSYSKDSSVRRCMAMAKNLTSVLPVWSELLQLHIPCTGNRTEEAQQTVPFHQRYSCAMDALDLLDSQLYQENLILSSLHHRTATTKLLVSLGRISIDTIDLEGPLLLLAAGDIQIQDTHIQAPLIILSAHGIVTIENQSSSAVYIQDRTRQELVNIKDILTVKTYSTMPLSYELSFGIPE